MSAVDGVILAGGRSARFGSDKCFATWGGRTFLARVASVLGSRAGRVFVLARHGADVAPYAREAPGARIVPDVVPGAGPVAALRDAMPLLRAPVVAVVACDAPGITGATLEHLIERASEGPAVLQVDGRALHSVFGMPRAALEARAKDAARLADLTTGAARIVAARAGLNVNERPKAAETQ